MPHWVSSAGPFVVAAFFVSALVVDGNEARVALGVTAGAIAMVLLVSRLRTSTGTSARSALPLRPRVIKWVLRGVFAALFILLLFISHTQWFWLVLAVAVAVLAINSFLLADERGALH